MMTGTLERQLGQRQQQCHTAEHAEPRLAEVDRTRIIIHVLCNLINTRQRMKHQHVLLGALHLLSCQLIIAFKVCVLLCRDKALALNASHVQHIQLGQNFINAVYLAERHIVVFQEFYHIVRQLECIRCDQIKLYIMIPLQEMQQRMHGTTVLQIAAQTNLHIVSRAAHTQNGNHIGKRLGRVQMTAVAGIDDRHRRVH